MDSRTYRFCLLARQLALSHGLSFAAAFLSENGIEIDVALAVLAPRQKTLFGDLRDNVTVYQSNVMVTYGDGKRTQHWWCD